MAKHILNTGDDDFDFVLLGITSSESQYRMVSLINDAVGINLFLSDYLPFSLKDSKVFRFSLYRFSDEELRLEYFFIPNNSNFEEPSSVPVNENAGLFSGHDVQETVKLIKELPKTDFFLLLKGEDLHHVQFKIAERLKKIEEIVQLQTIEPHELPSRRNLIF